MTTPHERWRTPGGFGHLTTEILTNSAHELADSYVVTAGDVIQVVVTVAYVAKVATLAIDLIGYFVQAP